MRVKALFRRARRAGGGVIFIDEIDSLGGRRGRTGGHPEDDRTLNQFLVEMDGFTATSGIVVVAATNRAADLDPALLRKGRFDRSVTIGLPSVAERAEILALHEAGHALAGVTFCPNDPLHKVTIQPRGAAMGVAFFQPDAELHLHSRRYLEGQIRKALGGRAAEALVYGADDVTSGASGDLQQATRIAKQMVYKLGMGRTTGLLTFDPDSGPVSGTMHATMDADVGAILEAAYDDVLALFRQQRPALEALADALLEQETLTGDAALAVMQQAGLAVAAGAPRFATVS
jgi:ATP-dependent Zn protease